MATIRRIDNISIDNVYSKIGKVYMFGAGNTVSTIYKQSDSARFINTIVALVVSDKRKESIDIAGIDILSILELPDTREINIVIAVRDYAKVLGLFDSFDNIMVYLPTDEAFDKLFENQSNIETLDYYKKLKRERLLFKYIEIETINRCNGECSFCPVNRNEKQREYKKMSIQLFNKIIDELSELNYCGELALFSNNEPFLDDRIVSFAKVARQKLPNAYIYLYSNGTLITEEKYIEIINYLDSMQIDAYIDDGAMEPSYVQMIRKWSKNEKSSSKMRFFRISPKAIRYSRAGNAPNKRDVVAVNELCRLPLVQFVVRPDGKVSLCCNDALGEMTLGDLNLNSILEIWNGKEYEMIRERIMRGRSNVKICKYCDSIDRRRL